MINEILEAKKRLYHLLLKKRDEVTDTEVNIMFNLANDKDIQDYLKEALKEIK